MFLKVVRKIRNLCDKIIEKNSEKDWNADFKNRTHHDKYCEHCGDKYCEHCGYLCDRCYRPF